MAKSMETTLIEDYLNERRPQWKTTLISDEPNGKTVLMEDCLKGLQRKTTSKKDDFKER